MLRTLTLAASFALAATAAQAESWNKLVTPAELLTLRASTAPLILDIRAPKAKGGGPSYAAGHIAGAVNAPYPSWRGPKANPGQALGANALTELLQSIGVERDRPVIVVHQGANATDFGAAARVYWTLKSSGVSQIAILNGGVNAWTKAKLPLSTEASAPNRSEIVATLSEDWLATREDIEAAVSGKETATLLDARPIHQFLGFSKHKAAKAPGTIPGAERFSQAEWFAPGSPMMSTPATATAIADASGVEGDEVISFCNTGHWAATNWFALSELAGREGVKLYAGSMVDWTQSGGALENTPAK